MQIYSFHKNEVIFHSNIAGSDRITANEGETIHLVCNITSGIPEENLMWFYKGKILNFGGPGSLNLKLTLLPKDIGRYVCKANSSALEEAMIKTVNIDVLCKSSYFLLLLIFLMQLNGRSKYVIINYSCRRFLCPTIRYVFLSLLKASRKRITTNNNFISALVNSCLIDYHTSSTFV